MGLVCVLESPGPVAVVRLTGPLNLGSSVEARACLQKALVEQPSGIVVDVSGLTVDTDVTLTMFNAFSGTAASWFGCPVVLCAPSAALRSALDRLAISRAVPVYATRAQAFAAVEAGPGARRYRRALPTTPQAAAIARQVVADACGAWRVLELVDRAEVVITELVANAVQHAGGDLRLTVALGERFLHVSVRDGSAAPPIRVAADPASDRGGRGLMLIGALATAWGSIPTCEGKVVWATLRLPA
jgi:anti-sigma regulatory factor (Ser/Thr protein kinase)/anti-anti-sigma regulatory factor